MATVRSVDDFMALQEEGGWRESKSGEDVAIPVGARPEPESVTRPSKWPGAMLRQPRYFIAPLKGNGETQAVWRRMGRKGSRKVRLMYVLKERVWIKPRFGFKDTVRRMAWERLRANFSKALSHAIATAK